jgi:hypothetical protein
MKRHVRAEEKEREEAVERAGEGNGPDGYLELGVDHAEAGGEFEVKFCTSLLRKETTFASKGEDGTRALGSAFALSPRPTPNIASRHAVNAAYRMIVLRQIPRCG